MAEISKTVVPAALTPEAAWWSRSWQYGNVCSYGALREDWVKMSGEEKWSMANLLRTMDYRLFLDTRYWRAIRLKIYSLRKWCEVCKRRGQFQVHHRHYRNRGREHENLQDLRHLCDNCHGTVTESVATIREAGVRW